MDEDAAREESIPNLFDSDDISLLFPMNGNETIGQMFSRATFLCKSEQKMEKGSMGSEWDLINVGGWTNTGGGGPRSRE